MEPEEAGGAPCPSLGRAPGRAPTDEVRTDRQANDDQEQVQDRSPATRKGERQEKPPTGEDEEERQQAGRHPQACRDGRSDAPAHRAYQSIVTQGSSPITQARCPGEISR